VLLQELSSENANSLALVVERKLLIPKSTLAHNPEPVPSNSPQFYNLPRTP
jgi:hypothetical protein